MVLWAGSGRFTLNQPSKGNTNINAATLGPSLGPVIAGYSVQAENWRWSQWEILWLSGPIFILMFMTLPETSAATILYHRAHRIRKVLKRTDLKSQSEIDQAHMNVKQVAFDALISTFPISQISKLIPLHTDRSQNLGKSMLLIPQSYSLLSIVSTPGLDHFDGRID